MLIFKTKVVISGTIIFIMLEERLIMAGEPEPDKEQ